MGAAGSGGAGPLADKPTVRPDAWANLEEGSSASPDEELRRLSRQVDRGFCPDPWHFAPPTDQLQETEDERRARVRQRRELRRMNDELARVAEEQEISRRREEKQRLAEFFQAEVSRLTVELKHAKDVKKREQAAWAYPSIPCQGSGGEPHNNDAKQEEAQRVAKEGEEVEAKAQERLDADAKRLAEAQREAEAAAAAEEASCKAADLGLRVPLESAGTRGDPPDVDLDYAGSCMNASQEAASVDGSPPVFDGLLCIGDHVQAITGLYEGQPGCEVLPDWRGVVDELSGEDAIVHFGGAEECRRYVLREHLGCLIVISPEVSADCTPISVLEAACADFESQISRLKKRIDGKRVDVAETQRSARGLAS